MGQEFSIWPLETVLRVRVCNGRTTIPCTLYCLSHPGEAVPLVGRAVVVKLGQDCTKSQL